MSARIMIAGTHSGCGKTSITLALLTAFRNRGQRIYALKCGPDYLDPLFHQNVLGVPSGNLDSYLQTEERIKRKLAERADGLTLIEAVMGYYDGYGESGKASSYEIASMSETPVLLVVRAKGMMHSAAALLRGFCEYRPDSGIKGVIFNGVPAGLCTSLSRIAKAEGLECLGVFPDTPRIELHGRRLGLDPNRSPEEIKQKCDWMGSMAETYLDVSRIQELAAKAPALSSGTKETEASAKRCKLAVARDEAFCMIYEDNLRELEEAGCEIVFFSPLRDAQAPDDCDGLYLPGGPLAEYKEELSANQTMIRSLRAFLKDGSPLLAEHGGFVYLHRDLDKVPLLGFLPASAATESRLQNFGYTEIRVERDCLIAREGTRFPAHEFHYESSEDEGEDCTLKKASGGKERRAIYASERVWAAFPQLYFPSVPGLGKRFARACIERRRTVS